MAAERRRQRASLDLLILLFLIYTTAARLVNISIDDTYGDSKTGRKPVYQPSKGPWYYPDGCTVSYDNDNSCGLLVPDASLAFDGTWTAAAYDPSYKTINITMYFTGISVWVFFILLNHQFPETGASTSTACNFTIDGNSMGAFSHVASDVGNTQFNVPAFNATGLDNSQHELVIWTNLGTDVLIFDYAMYTADLPDNTTSSSTLMGFSSTTSIIRSSGTLTPASRHSSPDSKLRIIIGCTLGGISLAVLVMVLLRFRRRGRKQRWIVEPVLATPFNQQLLVDNSNDVIISDTAAADLQQQNSSRDENPSPSEGILPNPHSFDSTGRPAILVQAARQMEINQHLQTAQQEIQNLSSRQESAIRNEPGGGSSDIRRQETERGIGFIQEQIRQLNRRIEHLRPQLSSDWAQGLSDEPPPAYS